MSDQQIAATAPQEQARPQVPSNQFVLEDNFREDPTAMEIVESEMPSCSSPLELLRNWSHELSHRNTHNGYASKLDALFRYGRLPSLFLR